MAVVPIRIYGYEPAQGGIFDFPFEIQIGQDTHNKRLFTVQHGKQFDERLDYATAAAKLGEAIMRALACEGMIDNEEVTRG